jgi:hypothetical protein
VIGLRYTSWHMYFSFFVRLHKSPWHTDWTMIYAYDEQSWVKFCFVFAVFWIDGKHCQIWSDRYTRRQWNEFLLVGLHQVGVLLCRWSPSNWLTSKVHYLSELLILSPQFKYKKTHIQSSHLRNINTELGLYCLSVQFCLWIGRC